MARPKKTTISADLFDKPKNGSLADEIQGLKQLTNEQIDFACEHILKRQHYDLLPAKLGFTSKVEFMKFCKANPQIEQLFEESRLESCKYLIDDALFVHDEYDAKAARVKLEAIRHRLSSIDPARYGNKIDLNVNQNVSIRSAIESSKDRVAELMKDVTPALLAPGIKKSIP